MKHASKTKKQPQASPLPAPPPRSSFVQWAVLGLVLLAACVGTWAVFEYVIWNKVPSELVGNWVVQGGEQDGATFDFYRNGTMLGRVNMRGQMGYVNAEIRVEEKQLYSTTEHPKTKELQTRVQLIRTLTTRQLVLEDEKGELLRLERAE
jgi:hypothetical protein